jgi:hypothetical protein
VRTQHSSREVISGSIPENEVPFPRQPNRYRLSKDLPPIASLFDPRMIDLWRQFGFLKADRFTGPPIVSPGVDRWRVQRRGLEALVPDYQSGADADQVFVDLPRVHCTIGRSENLMYPTGTTLWAA